MVSGVSLPATVEVAATVNEDEDEDEGTSSVIPGADAERLGLDPAS
jgi:hypothetical protein